MNGLKNFKNLKQMNKPTPPFGKDNEIVKGFRKSIQSAFVKCNFEQFQKAINKAVRHNLDDCDLLEFTHDWYVDYKTHWENDPIEFLKFHLYQARIDSHNYELHKTK